jgi:endonuclease/exonuclease/phosphatase family metal-dependent hydrolase
MVKSPLRSLVVRFLSIAAVFAGAACGESGFSESPGVGSDALRSALWTDTTAPLRLMAANISSGNNQSYDPGDGARIFQGVKPDVVMIQEFNYKTNSAADLRAFVDSSFGSTFSYYQESGAQIPNGVISRWPIREAGEWDDHSVSNRDFAWARIDIPGPVDLWAVSVHLLTASASKRQTEASDLAAYIRSKIPATDYLVIGGDFNTGSRTEPALSALSGLVVTTDSYPVDSRGNGNTNAARAKPYDWVLVDPVLHAYKAPTVIGTSSFATGLVVDTRTYPSISELSPARSSDSGATNMQHMAVVRDFAVPGD